MWTYPTDSARLTSSSASGPLLLFTERKAPYKSGTPETRDSTVCRSATTTATTLCLTLRPRERRVECARPPPAELSVQGPRAGWSPRVCTGRLPQQGPQRYPLRESGPSAICCGDGVLRDPGFGDYRRSSLFQRLGNPFSADSFWPAVARLPFRETEGDDWFNKMVEVNWIVARGKSCSLLAMRAISAPIPEPSSAASTSAPRTTTPVRASGSGARGGTGERESSPEAVRWVGIPFRERRKPGQAPQDHS